MSYVPQTSQEMDKSGIGVGAVANYGGENERSKKGKVRAPYSAFFFGRSTEGKSRGRGGSKKLILEEGQKKLKVFPR